MHYIIQENTFREQNYDNIINSLERLNLNYEIVKVLPFTENLKFKTKETNVFLFGSLKLARIGKNFNFYPGSLANENHNYEIYKDYYKDNLLNYDSIICGINDEIDFTKRKFIRPTLDTKTFTGAVFDKYEWDEKRQSCLKNKFVNKNVKIQVSKVKQIYNESRFWIVGGKISTYSTYRIGGFVNYKNNLVDENAIKFCEKMINIFQLADAFVMDIANTNNGYKIIECGCINCAGFYDADLQKLIIDLENYFNKI